MAEFKICWANSLGRPRLFARGSAERIGAIYHEPSDMCAADRVMLYALVRGLRPERTVEIGVRWGGGARIIAAALEDAGGPGMAVGVDPAPDAFRCRSRDLYGRYELLVGYSPAAILDAVAKLGGPIDLAIIDAMHTYDYASADFRGLIPHLRPGAHVLLHDAFHVGIDQAVADVLRDNPAFVDCGFLTRHPEIAGHPVAYQGWRLIRIGSSTGPEMIAAAYAQAGAPAPINTPEFWNWDVFANRMKQD